MRRALLLVASVVTACSALAGIDEPQRRMCETSADCPAGDPALGHPFCSATHTCETTCATSAECTGGLTDDPSICRADHTCAKLLSDDCRLLIVDPSDPLDDDVVVWFGAIWPRGPADATFDQARIDAVELMQRDFKTASGGLPPIREGGKHRRVGFVVCEESVDPVRAARHLVSTVRVPVILGPMHSGVVVRVATDVSIASGVLLLSSGATSPFITNLANKNGLVWRTIPSDALQALTMALAIQQKVEPELRASTVAPNEPLRVAVVHKGDSYGVGLESALFGKLVFNGKSAGENGASYRALDYGDPDDPNKRATDETYGQAVDAVLSFAPHIVIVVGTDEAVSKIFAPIEARWPAAVAHRPRYMLADGLHPRPDLLAVIGANADLRRRIQGTVPGTTSTQYEQFVRTYSGIFHDGTSPIPHVASTYDAAYLLAYATAAIGARELTGVNLSEALKKMVPPGPQIDVGPKGINDALPILASGGQIDFNGASGPLDFDVTTGDAESDIQVWCLSIDAAGQANGFVNSGWFYDATTKAMSGKIACP